MTETRIYVPPGAGESRLILPGYPDNPSDFTSIGDEPHSRLLRESLRLAIGDDPPYNDLVVNHVGKLLTLGEHTNILLPDGAFEPVPGHGVDILGPEAIAGALNSIPRSKRNTTWYAFGTVITRAYESA